MSDNHILYLLDDRPLSSLTATELEQITAHNANCDPCSSAYEAAQIAFALLQERSAVSIEPSPFFQTRVMAAIREKNQEKEADGILKFWQAAKALLTSMAAVVVLLTTLTIYTANTSSTEVTESSLSFNSDPAEVVIYGRANFDEVEITNSDALSDIYGIDLEDSDGK